MSFSIALFLTEEGFLTSLARQIALVMPCLSLWNPRMASMCIPPCLPSFDLNSGPTNGAIGDLATEPSPQHCHRNFNLVFWNPDSIIKAGPCTWKQHRNPLWSTCYNVSARKVSEESFLGIAVSSRCDYYSSWYWQELCYNELREASPELEVMEGSQHKCLEVAAWNPKALKIQSQPVSVTRGWTFTLSSEAAQQTVAEPHTLLPAVLLSP